MSTQRLCSNKMTVSSYKCKCLNIGRCKLYIFAIIIFIVFRSDSNNQIVNDYYLCKFLKLFVRCYSISFCSHFDPGFYKNMNRCNWSKSQNSWYRVPALAISRTANSCLTYQWTHGCIAIQRQIYCHSVHGRQKYFFVQYVFHYFKKVIKL